MSTDILDTPALFEVSRPDGAQFVPPAELHDLILNHHYAGRLPSISYAIGFYEDGRLVGGATIGKPASPPLCIGIAGPQWSDRVYELNRLVMREGMPRNALSRFMGEALRLLRSEQVILVSFADEGVGHHGYIYQATNWTYTGRTTPRTDKYMPGGKHPRHYTDEFAHLRRIRTAKHRYVFVPNKKLRKRFMRDMKYPVLPYPKGENMNYVPGVRHFGKVLDTRTGEVFEDTQSSNLARTDW